MGLLWLVNDNGGDLPRDEVTLASSYLIPATIHPKILFKMTEQSKTSQLAISDHIPIIDLSTLDSPDLEERQQLARSIYEVCTEVGFFYIKVQPFSLVWD
jgi:hypothetical protein